MLYLAIPYAKMSANHSSGHSQTRPFKQCI